MATAPVTSVTEIPSAVTEFYDKNLLERAQPYLCHDKFGQRRPFKSRSGLTIRFRRYNALAAATTALTEGVTPAGNQLSKTDVTATLSQYGDWTKITDVVDFSNIDPVITEATDVFAEQAALSVDTVIRDKLLACTNIFRAGSVGATSSIITAITLDELRAISRLLKRQNARMFTELVKAGTGISTFPVRPCFIIVAHVDLEKTIRALGGFIPVEQYASQNGVLDNEIGAVDNFRIVLTTNAYVAANGGGAKGTCLSTGGTNLDAYKCLVFAKDAYGVCPLDGENFKTIVKKNEGGYADPLNQIAATVGWKATTTAAILNNAWMVVIETGATA